MNKTLVFKSIGLSILLTLTANLSFADGGSGTGGGGAVQTGNHAALADYFQDPSFQPFEIADDVRAELEDLKQLSTIMGLSFGDSFWDCDVMDKDGCNGANVDYRSVTKLPIWVQMKIKGLRQGTDLYIPFGFTPGTIDPNGSGNTSITYIDESVYDLLDTTDKAIALVHERFWAHFGLKQSYENLTWYTQTLRMLRDVEAGRKVYGPTEHEQLMKYGYYAMEMITSDRSGRPSHHSYMNINGNKCVVFGVSTIPADFAQLKINDGSAGGCYGFYKMVGTPTLKIDQGNEVLVNLTDRTFDTFQVSIQGITNHVEVVPDANVQINGNSNLVRSSKISTILNSKVDSVLSIQGTSNDIQIAQGYSIQINGNANIIHGNIGGGFLRINNPGDVFCTTTDYPLESQFNVTGDSNHLENIAHGVNLDIRGNSNDLQNFQFIRERGTNFFCNAKNSYFENYTVNNVSVLGNKNNIMNISSSQNIKGNNHKVDGSQP